MRMVARTLIASAILGLGLAAGSGVHAHSGALAATPRVLMYDNDGSFQGIDPVLSEWGFIPDTLVVSQGAQIVFDNPASNLRPHSISSISWSGAPPHNTLDIGAKFNSSPTADQFIMPGSTWTLDTATLDPGRYDFFCSIHPWMVGSITVTPAS